MVMLGFAVLAGSYSLSFSMKPEKPQSLEAYYRQQERCKQAALSVPGVLSVRIGQTVNTIRIDALLANDESSNEQMEQKIKDAATSTLWKKNTVIVAVSNTR